MIYCVQEYSEDSNSEPDVDLENQYYNSKALKEEDPQAALASFQRVLDLENNEKGEWGFKALKQMIKINFKSYSSKIIIQSIKKTEYGCYYELSNSTAFSDAYCSYKVGDEIEPYFNNTRPKHRRKF